MSFTSWLRNLRSFCRLGTTINRKNRRAALRGPAKRFRPQLESLEDRCLPSFSPVATYAVDVSPMAIVSADFNNDGRLDLATANTGSDSVSVLLGNGNGTFLLPINSDAGLDADRLVVADFNNDGKLDLVVGNTQYYWGKLLLLGNGDGAFQAPIFTELNFSRDSLAAGDFNADGHMDLVQVQIEPDFADYVQVYLGDGTGHFMWWGEPVYFSNYAYTPMVVADLNDDSRPDVVLAHEDSSYVSVLLCNADGTLSYHAYFATGNYNRSVVVDDFTGDGIPDVATASSTRAAILPGDGNGNFGAPIIELTHNANQTAVATADFNGDGKPDLVTTDLGEGALTALLGLGGGMLSLVRDHAVGLSPSAVAVGDFNGDGRPDAATANAGSNTVSVLFNDGVWPDVSAPRLRIDDAPAVIEGHAGTVEATFTVSLSFVSDQPVSVNYTTANGTATAGSDYQAQSGTLIFAPGETRKTITVLVNGDRVGEANETFFVNLSSPTNATIADGQAVVTIVDDEPRISIGDVTKAEGKNNQTTLFTFTVTLSAAYDVPVTLNFATTDGTAKTSDNDYVANSGTITFAPGQTTKTITVVVKGDKKKEASENFFVDLSDLSSYAVFLDSRGMGTIQNDD